MNGLNRKAEDRLQGTSNGPGGTGFIPSAPGKARNQRDDAGAGGRRGAERANTEGSPGTACGGAVRRHSPGPIRRAWGSTGPAGMEGENGRDPASTQEQSRESGAGSTGWETRSQVAGDGGRGRYPVYDGADPAPEGAWGSRGARRPPLPSVPGASAWTPDAHSKQRPAEQVTTARGLKK